MGWVDGRQNGAYNAVEMFKPELIKRFFDANSPTHKLFPPTITVGQLEAGLDKFYGDYRTSAARSGRIRKVARFV